MYMKRWSLVDANGGETGLSVFPLRGGGRLVVVGDEGDLKFAFVVDMVVQERKCKRHCVTSIGLFGFCLHMLRSKVSGIQSLRLKINHAKLLDRYVPVRGFFG
jgi:hypothetical protein